MSSRIALFAAILSFGCTYHVGVDGLSGSLFGSHYHHRETFSDAVAVAEGEEPGGYLKSWSTVGGRTYGTVDLEWHTNESEEKGSMRGDGMSDNLQQTLGDDAIETLGDDAKCVLMPALCADGLGGLGLLGESLSGAVEGDGE